MSIELTIETAIQIQTEQLNRWKVVLSALAFEQLVDIVTKDNAKAKSGYDIVRGDTMYEIIMNRIAPKCRLA